MKTETPKPTSPYLKRPKRSLEDVLWARYEKLCKAVERLSGQARVLAPEEVENLLRLQAEIAALERELYGVEPDSRSVAI